MKNSFYILLAPAFLLANCTPPELNKVVITNSLSFDRNDEVVQLSLDQFEIDAMGPANEIGLVDEQGEWQLIQWLDENEDGKSDALLFQPNVASSGVSTYWLKNLNGDKNPTSDNTCYSRFVPERTDDYTWENDRVAFRMYGPTAQKMIEDSVPGGTLSSGVDCWLKKVEYPIIDKWYAKHIAKTGSYHKDTGEGLDDFHVGVSRGCGGIAVLIDEEYYFSKNYTAYKTLANGFMRTAVDFEFAPWEIGVGNMVSTTKHISLDRGSQLSRIEVDVVGVNQIEAGLTLHENDGVVLIDSLGGWVSYWQPHGDSFLGTALVAAPGTFLGATKVVSEQKDLSNVYLSLAVKNGKTIYYSGFFWEKSQQFINVEEWHAYLDIYTQQLATPLEVTIMK